MIVLLSPTKRQAAPDDGSLIGACGVERQPRFIEEATELRRHIATLRERELASLFSLSDKKAAELYQIYHGKAARRRALDLFRGPSFTALLGEGIPGELCEIADSSLRILSGLYGILTPFDTVESYRLDPEQRLPAFRTPNLYEFWGKKVTESLLEEDSLRKEPLILDLASKEYSSLIDHDRLREAGIARIAPDFATLKEGRERRLSVHSKQGRGGLARYLLSLRARAPEATWDVAAAYEELAAARWDGFFFVEDGSTELRPRFLKEA